MPDNLPKILKVRLTLSYGTFILSFKDSLIEEDSKF